MSSYQARTLSDSMPPPDALKTLHINANRPMHEPMPDELDQQCAIQKQFYMDNLQRKSDTHAAINVDADWLL